MFKKHVSKNDTVLTKNMNQIPAKKTTKGKKNTTTAAKGKSKKTTVRAAKKTTTRPNNLSLIQVS
jgi:hypothetical protein